MDKELAVKILELVGGKSNVVDVWHCATRLRLTVQNKESVSLDELNKIKGVVTAQFSGDQLQVVIGNRVNKVYSEFSELVGPLKPVAKESTGSNKNIVSNLMELISGIFTPILPVIAGTGLLKGLLTLATGLGWMGTESSIYRLLFIIADCAFYFLPFLLASSAAKIFKVNNFLSLTVAGALLYPTITDGYKAVSSGAEFTPIHFGFINVPVLNYSSSVIPIILAIWLLSVVEPRVKKVVPRALNIMFSPMITLLIVIPLTLILLGPLGNYIGQVLVIGISWLFDNAGLFAGALLGVGMPLIIMTGMHYALFPVVFNNFALLGYDTMMNPVALVTNVAQSGAAFAVAVKTKNKNTKELAISSGISALLGITEPALYGINLKFKRPFYACLIAGGISGAIVVGFGLKSFAFLTGLISLTAYVDPKNGWNIVIAIGGFVLSFVLAFILTLVLGFDEEVEEEHEQEDSVEHTINSALIVTAPVKGQSIRVEDIKDKVFSKQIMGPTYAIIPTDDKVVSPVTGEIVYVADSGHAIGLKTPSGIEVLLHVGIDTVELNGKYFNPLVKAGDNVQNGQVLLECEFSEIGKIYDTSVITILTNGHDLEALQKDGIGQEVTTSTVIMKMN